MSKYSHSIYNYSDIDDYSSDTDNEDIAHNYKSSNFSCQNKKKKRKKIKKDNDNNYIQLSLF